jgi:2-dehydro-3-deoxyphosphogluconate aldolase/(4S)-4-hydroxy-2-oxoglutarate aldolase
LKRNEVRARIESVGVVPAIRVSSAEDARFAAEAVSNGGIPILEIAMTVPGATEVISYLVQHNPELVVGAGSVRDREAAQLCLDAGAHFLTSDGLHLALLQFAAEKDVVVFPGALTPTEVITAWESGCDFVKVVPCAHIGGQTYIRSLHEMFPQIPLIAAGGINQQTASQYILAGAVVLGIGHELIPPRAIRHRDANRIAELSRRFVGAVKSARQG